MALPASQGGGEFAFDRGAIGFRNRPKQNACLEIDISARANPRAAVGHDRERDALEWKCLDAVSLKHVNNLKSLGGSGRAFLLGALKVRLCRLNDLLGDLVVRHLLKDAAQQSGDAVLQGFAYQLGPVKVRDRQVRCRLVPVAPQDLSQEQIGWGHRSDIGIRGAQQQLRNRRALAG